MTVRSVLVAAVVLVAAALSASRAGAQACGPLDFQIAETGAGCALSGGPVPQLDAFVVAAEPLCNLQFTMDQGEFAFPISGALLPIGVGNPNLAIWPGCVLRVTPLAVVTMVPDVVFNRQHYSASIPADPIFVGLTLFTQALWPVGGELRFSNGLRIDM